MPTKAGKTNAKPLPTDGIPEKLRCAVVFIPNSQYFVDIFLGAMTDLEKWTTYQPDENRTAKQVGRAWAVANAETFPLTACETYNSNCDEIIEDEPEMKLTIETRNGVSYLRQDCGCDEPRYYQLSAASSPDNAQVIEPGSTVTNPSQLFPETISNEPCFASAAYDYLTGRFLAYDTYVRNVLNTTIDIALGPVDEGFDMAKILLDFYNGSSDSQWFDIWTHQDYVDAIADPETRSAMIDGWNFTGEVNRLDLLGWVNRSAPGLFGVGVPLRGAMNYWLINSIVPRYNRALALLARDCDSQRKIYTPEPEVTPPLGKVAYTEELNGYLYTIVKLTDGFAWGGATSPQFFDADWNSDQVVAAFGSGRLNSGAGVVNGQVSSVSASGTPLFGNVGALSFFRTSGIGDGNKGEITGRLTIQPGSGPGGVNADVKQVIDNSGLLYPDSSINPPTNLGAITGDLQFRVDIRQNQAGEVFECYIVEAFLL